MTAIQDVIQEPSHTYYTKLRVINKTVRPLDVATFNDTERANVMKSKMTGRFFSVPAQNLYNANTNIVTETEVYNWMQGKYRETMIGNQRVSLKGYEKRIRPYVLSIVDEEVLLYLYYHLPSRLETRIRIANPNIVRCKKICTSPKKGANLFAPDNTINDFFTQLRIIWLESGESTSNFGNEINTSTSAIAYNDLSDPIAIHQFVENDLTKNYGRQSNHIKKEPFGQNNNTRSAKKYPSFVKKSKKVNNVYQSEPENSDDEEVVILKDNSDSEEEKEITSENESQSSQIRQNWPNPFEIDFLDIKEPNDVTMILCRIGDLIIPHAILDTSANNSLYTDNIPEYLGIKIDKKNVYKLTGAVGDFQSIGTSYNVPITIGTGEDSITVSENEQHHVRWDPIVKGKFTATHNGKTIIILLSTRKESRNAFNTEKLQVSEVNSKSHDSKNHLTACSTIKKNA
ncbi:hypothetical protein Glove_243g15 [Diversispora epigaea]|uniref:Uncharacterized protein n=1 Tax=Diversispora epigaea TaxID=1348612 RepID=A0A397IBP0_9GLOM|nr:hypothetical protein Glove_243g15 [Diversispora epigaea]